MSRTYHKSRWPIGFFGLLLMPVILMWQIWQCPQARVVTTMEVNLPPAEFWEIWKANYPAVQLPGQGRWATFEFSPDERANSWRYEQLRLRVRDYFASRDTTTGIHIHIDRGARYGMFVQIVDMLNQENITFYSIEGSDLWLPKFHPFPNDATGQELVSICGGVIRVPQTLWSEYRDFISYNFRFLQDARVLGTLYFLAGAVVAMSSLDIYRIINANRRRVLKRRLPGVST
jgi:hypothetical protein